MASTHSPTSRLLESPRRAATKPGGGFSMRTTAMSVLGSAPTTLAGNSRPSAKITVTLAACSATWLLVMMLPLPSITTPDPCPARASKAWEIRRRAAEEVLEEALHLGRHIVAAKMPAAAHFRGFHLDVQPNHAGPQGARRAGKGLRQRARLRRHLGLGRDGRLRLRLGPGRGPQPNAEARGQTE
jgi:hypothetical protein